MNRRFFILLGALFFSMALCAGEISLSNLAISPRYPWNGKIDITYSLVGENSDDECQVAFIAYEKDKNCYVDMTSVTGDGIGVPMKIGGPYHVVWDSAKDQPSGNSASLMIKGLLGPYMVVNLEDGSVRYTTTAPDLTDDTCRTTELWLRYIPAGTFIMGTGDSKESTWRWNEHQVILTKDFYIGIFEITLKQYELITGTKFRDGLYTDDAWYASTSPVYYYTSYVNVRGTQTDAGAEEQIRQYKVGDNSFMGKLRKLTGLIFDLPTEAQWEYACRAGTTTDLNTGKNCESYGSSDPAMDEAGRYEGNSGGSSDGTIAKVGSYLPNAWGIYDMHGNVWELCLDTYGSEQILYRESVVVDPLETGGVGCILRGGDYMEPVWACCFPNCKTNGFSLEYDYWGAGIRVVFLPYVP